MDILFTSHATNRIEENGISSSEINQLVEKLKYIAKDPKILSESQGSVRINSENDNMYIIRIGNMRAVLNIDNSDKNRVVVMSVYYAGNQKPDDISNDTQRNNTSQDIISIKS